VVRRQRHENVIVAFFRQSVDHLLVDVVPFGNGEHMVLGLRIYYVVKVLVLKHRTSGQYWARDLNPVIGQPDDDLA